LVTSKVLIKGFFKIPLHTYLVRLQIGLDLKEAENIRKSFIPRYTKEAVRKELKKTSKKEHSL
jgi:hypothetical protein